MRSLYHASILLRLYFECGSKGHKVCILHLGGGCLAIGKVNGTDRRSCGMQLYGGGGCRAGLMDRTDQSLALATVTFTSMNAKGGCIKHQHNDHKSRLR